MNKIFIEISPGELVDRVTILRLKSERIAEARKLALVRIELSRHEDLLKSLSQESVLLPLIDQLFRINARLWEVEDDLRICEREGDFGPKFIELARTVYQTNDARFATKQAIDQALGASVTEVKSYSVDEAPD